MADEIKLAVTERTSFGKGAARKLRAAGQVPAVLYGHGTAPRHLALPGHDTMLIIRKANALITLDIAGESQVALVKDVQRDPVRQIIEHLDLVVIRKGERVEVEVPLVLVGEPFGGAIAVQDAATIHVSAAATNIPEHIEVSVEGLEDGTIVHDADIALPEGVSLIESEQPVIVVNIQTPRGEAADEAEAAAE